MIELYSSDLPTIETQKMTVDHSVTNILAGYNEHKITCFTFILNPLSTGKNCLLSPLKGFHNEWHFAMKYLTVTVIIRVQLLLLK